MSLSKYYQSSDSFQPEGIIKREGQVPSGWQSSQPEERLPFQTQQLPSTPKPADTLQVSETQNITKKIDADKEKSQQVVAKEIQPAPIPLQQVIDLSNYLELNIAEKKIEEAYQKGIQTGKEKVEQDFGAATRALLSACQQIDTVRETIIKNSSRELQEFALAIAERILRLSVREQDSTIIATIEEALQRAVKSDEFTIYINPDDYQIVTENADDIVAGLTGLNKVVIKKDTTIERGGTKIESDNCTIDATIASQFETIREEIKKDL